LLQSSRRTPRDNIEFKKRDRGDAAADVREQALAMSNVEAMLKPGAFLLANFSAPNLTSGTIRPVETTTTLYARARDVNENILDFIVWYKAHAN